MAIDQDITNLPTPPSRSDSPSDFSDKADTFLAALPTLQTELNTYADEANATQQVINTSESNAATSETNAEDWASKTDGIVLTTDYSAKAYAISDNLIPEGAAKEWAIKIGGTVDGTDFSAKKYANDAQSSADAAASLAGATAWSAGVTYDTNDAAIGSDGNTYRSLVDGNIGNDPVAGDGTKWLNLTGTADVTKAELTKTFAAGESASLTLSEEVTTAPVVSVTKEVPQTGVTSNDWDVASDGANYTLHDTAYDTTLTPSVVGDPSADISTATYSSKSYATGIAGTSADLYVGNGGVKLYTLVSGVLYQHTLSTAYDISTATYDSVSYTVSSEDSQQQSFFIKDDGTKLYVAGLTNGKVYQYTLSSAWDISTASYDSVAYTLPASYPNQPVRGLFFKGDGTKFYSGTPNTDLIYEFDLSTAWDISTASYNSVNISAYTSDVNNTDMAFSSDGLNMFVIFSDFDTVAQYALSTAWDLSTASYTGNVLSVSSQDANPQGIMLSADNTKLYVIGNANDTVYQYSLPSVSALVLGTGSFASTDVGKRIVGNGGEAILTATDGSYELQTAFNDDSTIAAGDWSMFALDVESADAGLTLSGLEKTFDLAGASYSGKSFSLSSEDTAPTSITFSNNGDKLFALGELNDQVYQYNLSSPFDVTTATQVSSLDVSAQETDVLSVLFDNSGTKMYVMGRSTNKVYQYSLSTAFDLTTASYDNVSFDVSGQVTTPFDMAFNDTGSNMYILDASSVSEVVFQYSLSSNFDIGTVSYENKQFNFSGLLNSPISIYFNNDGTEMIIGHGAPDSIKKFSLSTPYDVSSASYDNVTIDIESIENDLRDVIFNSSGTKMYIVGLQNATVYEFDTGEIIVPTSANHTAITTASTDTEFWTDINSMTADDTLNDGAAYYAVSTDDRTTWSIIDDTEGVRNIVRNNGGTWEVNDASDYGTETWVAATTNDEFYALEEAVDSSTAQSVIGFAPADQWSYSGNSFSVTSEDGTPQQVFFKPDGLKMFVLGAANDSVYEYNISTAWDVSTASYTNKSFDVSAQESSPGGLFFKPDGTKMFVSGFVGESLNEYTLSTPWDISTASYNNSSFSLTSQDGSPAGIFFKPDGSRFYFIGGSNDNVFQYNLSTPWDVSTVSYFGIAFDISSQDTSASGLTFKPDGTKMYIAGEINDKIHEYELSTDWDISTASYTNKSFDVSPQDSKPLGISFKPDGTKLFLVGDGNNLILDYDTTKNTSTNRMDATQLNAVSDANHYTLGNDLDLAITLFMADGNTNSPTSDGVSINYDANVLNQGAVLGTDYEFDKPTNDTVRITALSDENLKVRVV